MGRQTATRRRTLRLSGRRRAGPLEPAVSRSHIHSKRPSQRPGTAVSLSAPADPRYPLSSRFSSLKKRQSVPWAIIFCGDRKSTRLNSSHLVISYAVFCLKKKKKEKRQPNHRTQNLT